MKKLMLFATMLAIGGFAFADAQVYELQLTLKTTVTRSGTPKFLSCDCPIEDSSLYRKQGNVRIKGVIWGCDCSTIAEPMISDDSTSLATSSYGYIFWNETTRKPLNLTFEWVLLNRIDSTGKKVEGTWVLYSEDETFYVTGAGFGTVKDTVTKDPCERTATWVPKMNGNVAGWSTPGAIVTVEGKKGECSWCEKVADTEEETASAAGWTLCDCGESDERTAASGTWKMKYVTAASKKLSSKTAAVEKVTEAYNFPSYVKSVIE